MEKEKIIEIANDVENRSNKDLFDASNDLHIEYEKTKDLIVNLTRHMEGVEQIYSKIKKEIDKRTKK